MRILLFFFMTMSLYSCSHTVTPALFKDDTITKPSNEYLKGKIIRVDPLEDRRDIKDHPFLNTKKKEIKYKNLPYCVNGNKGYRKNFNDLLARLSGYYINERTSISKFTTKGERFDYVLRMSLDKYEMLQDVSTAAKKERNKNRQMVGLSYGGFSLAFAIDDYKSKTKFESFAKLKIQLSNIAVLDSERNELFKLEDRIISLKEKMRADATCDCAYLNIDYAFMEIIDGIAKELEEKLVSHEMSMSN